MLYNILMIQQSLLKFCKIVSVFAVILGIFATPFSTFAADPKEILQQKIVELEKQMAAIDNELGAIAGKKETLSSHIAELQLSRKKLAAQVASAEVELKKEKQQVAELGNSITEHTKVQTLNRTSLARLIREINAADEETTLVPLLKNADISSFLRAYSELPLIFTALGTSTRRLQVIKSALATEKEKSEESVKKTAALTSQIKNQKSIYDSLHAQSSAQLKTTTAQEKQFQTERLALEKLKQEFEAEIYKYEAGLAFSGFSKTTPTRGTKVFAWPVDDVFITQLFGKTSASGRLYASGSHSGVDFRATVGTPVRAMANGVVMGSGDTDTQCKGASFGKWIYIAYENGLGTTYGHLSRISATTGQKVSAGDVVAYSGNTGHSTGPHLHVSTYALTDSNGNKLVDVSAKQSISCKGKILTQPTAPVGAYLNLLDYTAPVDPTKIKY